MNQLIEILQGQLSDNVLDAISSRTGVQNKQATASAAQDALSAIMAGLAKNTQSKQGAESLVKALENDHDGSVLDHLNDILSGNIAGVNDRAVNGAGILKHILGNNTEKVAGQLAQRNNLDASSMSSMMEMLAPVVMGALGKTRKSSGLDITDLISMLNKGSKAQTKKSGMGGLLGQLLDQDGDGDPTNDIIGMGMKMLGGFFKKK